MGDSYKHSLSKRVLAVLSVLVMVLWPVGVAALDPTDGSDAKEDADGDGLNNVDEFTWGTDPNNFDTDADLTPDGWEVHFRGVWYERQLDSKSQEAYDAAYSELPDDRQAQVREAISSEWSVSPLSPINGGDAGFVAQEIISAAKGNPVILYGWIDADAQKYLNDPDEDGFNNLHEYVAGTDPTSANTDGDSYTKDSQDPNPLIPDDYESSQPGGVGSGSDGQRQAGKTETSFIAFAKSTAGAFLNFIAVKSKHSNSAGNRQTQSGITDGQFQGPGQGSGGQGQGQGTGQGQGQGEGQGQGQGQGQGTGQGTGQGQGQGQGTGQGQGQGNGQSGQGQGQGSGEGQGQQQGNGQGNGQSGQGQGQGQQQGSGQSQGQGQGQGQSQGQGEGQQQGQGQNQGGQQGDQQGQGQQGQGQGQQQGGNNGQGNGQNNNGQNQNVNLPPTRITIDWSEAGFGSPNKAITKGQPFQIKGHIEYRDADTGMWNLIASPMDVEAHVKLGSQQQDYKIGISMADLDVNGNPGAGYFSVDAIIPSDAPAGEGLLGVAAVANGMYAGSEVWESSPQGAPKTIKSEIKMIKNTKIAAMKAKSAKPAAIKAEFLIFV